VSIFRPDVLIVSSVYLLLSGEAALCVMVEGAEGQVEKVHCLLSRLADYSNLRYVLLRYLSGFS